MQPLLEATEISMELPLLSTFDDGEVCVKRPAEAVDLESKISIVPSAVCVFLCFGLFASNSSKAKSSMCDIRYSAVPAIFSAYFLCRVEGHNETSI